MSVAQLSERRALTGGFYTVQEVTRILGIESDARIKNWVSGAPNKMQPVIKCQYRPRDGVQELGFWDLMEVRFIDYFRRRGVSLQSIRKAAEAARHELDSDRPFAMSDIKFVTDRKRIFVQAANDLGDDTLRDIVSGQYAMYDVIEEFLAAGVEFDPGSGLAERWHPYPKALPNILLDPLRAHGQPIIDKYRIPTSAVFDLWRAEKQDSIAVADWYEVEEEYIEQAIKFELGMVT